MSASSTHCFPRQVTVCLIVSNAWCADSPGAKPVARGQKVGFEDRLEHDLRRCHHHPVGHTRDPERPQLAWLARLGDMHPPQRPRTVLARPQLRGELVEELIDPEALHVIDRYAIDTGGAPG